MAVLDHFDGMEENDDAASSATNSMRSAHTPSRRNRHPDAPGRGIEDALNEAEQLLRLGSATRLSQRTGATHQMSSIINASEQLRLQVRELRIENHESKVELVTLRAQLAQRESTAQRAEHEAAQQIAERDRLLAELSAAHASCQEHAASLAAQLAAARSLDPEAVSRLRAEHAAAVADAARSAQAVTDLQARLEAHSARGADAMRCWTGVRDGLQREATRLAACLERKNAEVQDMRQEREILRAKVGLLSGRSADAWEGNGEEGAEWKERAETLETHLRDREATCHKYKLAVRALKRRQAEVEGAAAASSAAAQLRERGLHARIAELEAQLAAAEREAAEARAALALATPRAEAAGRDGADSRREPAPDAHLPPEVHARAVEEEEEEERDAQVAAEWEARAREAEGRTEAAVRATAAAAAAAVRLANRRASAAEAKARVASAEAQSLRLRLESGQRVHQPAQTFARDAGPGSGAEPSHRLPQGGQGAGPMPVTRPHTPLSRAGDHEDWAAELGRHEGALRELERKLAAGASRQEQASSPAVPGHAAEARQRTLESMLDKFAEKSGAAPRPAPDLIAAG